MRPNDLANRRIAAPRAQNVPRHNLATRGVLIAFGILPIFLAARPARAIDYLADRRQQVEAMSADEKDALRDKFAKFEALPVDEQDRLRHLHELLESDPQGEMLRRTMQRYHEWLKTLSPSDRADLLGLPPAERLARIKILKHDQEARAASLAADAHLIGRDVASLSHWIEQFATDHETELIRSVVSARRRQDLKNLDSAARHKKVTLLAWQRWRTPDKVPLVADAEITRLAEQLSPEARRALEGQATQPDRVQMIHEWAQAIAHTRMAAGLTAKGGGLVSADLSHFFQNDLTQAERDSLMKLSRDDLHRELRKLYLQRKHLPESPLAPGKKSSSDAKPAGT